MILGAAVASVLVAILIVKFLPLNLRWIASVLLLILAIFLGYKIYQGIMEPIQFAKEKVERYKPVIQKLKIIRDAQMKHYEVTDIPYKPQKRPNGLDREAHLEWLEEEE